MPEISRFYGIVIRMFFADHAPPHFHAEYGEHEALLTITEGRIFSGALPGSAQRLVSEWADMHREELLGFMELGQAIAASRQDRAFGVMIKRRRCE